MAEDTITLREYLEAKLGDSDKAVSVALTTLDKRLESMNEFRDTLRDQAAKFIIRTEFELVVSRLEQDIKNLEAARALMVTVTTYNAAHSDLQKQVEELRLSKAVLEGKASQESVNQVSSRAQFGLLFGVIATVIAVINFASRFF